MEPAMKAGFIGLGAMGQHMAGIDWLNVHECSA